jgi:DNA-directed RNA polymerase specialized sigma24 family protein
MLKASTEVQDPISEAIFVEWWEDISPKLLGWLRKKLLGRTPEDVEEIYQRVAEIAWRNRDDLRHRRLAGFRGWVFVIAANVLNDYLGQEFSNHPQSLDDFLAFLEGGASGNSEDDSPGIEPSSLTDRTFGTPENDPLDTRASLFEALEDAVGAPKDEGGLDPDEAALIRERALHSENSLKEAAVLVGVEHPEQRYFRAIPKFVVFLFLHRPEHFGGMEVIEDAFVAAVQSRRTPLSLEEALTFREVVLKGNRRYRAKGWRLSLRSACLKVRDQLPKEILGF